MQETVTKAAIAGRIDRALSGRVARRVADAAGVTETELSYYRQGKRTPSPPRLAALADALGVRPGWLLTGQGRMRANVMTVHERALHEVDGLMADWDAPADRETAEEEAEAFEAGWRRHDTNRFDNLAPVVRLVFVNLLARAFARLREAGHDTTDPEWRGRIAGRLIGRVRDREAAAGYNTGKESTRAWIQSMGAEMEQWETNVANDIEDEWPELRQIEEGN